MVESQPQPAADGGLGARPEPVWRRAALLALVAVGYSLLRTDGSVGIDAFVRAASARWLWAGVSVDVGLPPSIANLMLLEGADGRPHAWFGIGQQLLVVPFDVLYYNLAAVVPALAADDMRVLFLSLTVFPLVVAAACVALFAMLVSLGRSTRAAWWATVVVLVGSAFHHHTLEGFEVGEEVAYLALGVGSMAVLARGWSAWGAVGLVVGAAMPILLRLPHVSYALGLMAVAVVMAWRGDAEARGRWRRALWLLGVGVVLGLTVDRVFHAVRFGEWTTTYIMKADVQLARVAGNEALQPGFLFSGSPVGGFVAQLVSLNKGVVFYSPLVWVAALLAASGRWMDREAAAAAVAVALAFAMETAFYAPYVFTFDTNWWGNRFTEAPVVVLTAMLVAAWLDEPTRAAWWQRTLFVLIVVWAIVTARVGSFTWF